jgi:hypothetical protein
MPINPNDITKKHKWGILCIVLFFALQILVDLPGSLTAYPFLHYGMFSQKFLPADYYNALQLEIDGKTITSHECNEWETILSYTNIHFNNRLSNDNEIEKKLIEQYTPLLPFKTLKHNLMNSYCSTDSFNLRYQLFLEGILKRKIKTILLCNNRYAFREDTFGLVKRDTLLNYSCKQN